jgi:hypothetical protein
LRSANHSALLYNEGSSRILNSEFQCAKRFHFSVLENIFCFHSKSQKGLPAFLRKNETRCKWLNCAVIPIAAPSCDNFLVYNEMNGVFGVRRGVWSSGSI